MSTSTTQMYAVLKFADKTHGWQEKYWLQTGDYASALTELATLLSLRTAILPHEAELLRARVSFAGRPSEKEAPEMSFPLPGPVVGTYTPAPSAFSETPHTAVHVELETASGKWASYYIRSLPDSQVERTVLKNRATLVIPAGGTPQTVVKWEDALGNFLQWMRQRTRYAARIADSGDDLLPTFTTETWNRIIVRGLSNRKTGRPVTQTKAGRRARS